MITDDIKRYYNGELRNREIIPLCLDAGMNAKTVSSLLGVSLSCVYKHRSDAAGRRQRRLQALADSRRSRHYEPKTENPHTYVDRSGWDSHDDAEPVWITDRTVRLGEPRKNRHGTPRPEPPPKVEPLTRVGAINAYLDGDRGALRVYFESVGR